MSSNSSSSSSSAVSSGISTLTAIGITIAIHISWGITGGSIAWAIWDGLFGWFYIFWRLFIVHCYQNCV